MTSGPLPITVTEKRVGAKADACAREAGAAGSGVAAAARATANARAIVRNIRRSCSLNVEPPLKGQTRFVTAMD
jgi:hypothetical protein